MLYCPKCATPIEGVKFCRSCGANVSLVPQALTGQLPTAPVEDVRARLRKRRTVTPERAMSNLFTGLAFLVISLAVWRYAPAGRIWWFWLLIPAFACVGEGIGQLYRMKLERRNEAPAPKPAAPELPAPATSSLGTPASVTEHTTKHLK